MSTATAASTATATTTREIPVRRPGGRVAQLRAGAPVYLTGDRNGAGVDVEYAVETPDGFVGHAHADSLTIVGAYGVRRDPETGDWMVVDRYGWEIAPRLPESLTATEATCLIS